MNKYQFIVNKNPPNTSQQFSIESLNVHHTKGAWEENSKRNCGRTSRIIKVQEVSFDKNGNKDLNSPLKFVLSFR